MQSISRSLNNSIETKFTSIEERLKKVEEQTKK